MYRNRSPMKILMLSWNYPPVIGGIEYLVGHVCEGLTDRGHDVVVLTSHHPRADTSRQIFRAGRPGLISFLLFALRRGWKDLRTRRPSMILVGSLTAAPVAWMLSRATGVPYAVITYGSDLVLPRKGYQFMLRRVLRGARRVVAISEHTKGLVLERGVPSGCIVLIEPGADQQAASRPPSPETQERWRRLTDGRRVLLSVGRLIRRKGLLEFVRDVMPPLIRTYPDVLLLIVGEDARHSLMHRERMSEAIRAVIAEKELGESVRILGRLSDEDLQAVYECTDVFIMPCLDLPHDVEGFGIVQVEAGLRGVPSVSTRVGGIPDAVEDGVSGLLVPPGHPGAIERAIARLLENDVLRRRMGEEAARRAREKFAWEVIVSRYEQMIEEAFPPAVSHD